MASQIIFFKKSHCDISRPNLTATASESPETAAYPLNRTRQSAWITTGSVDANNTTWEVDWFDLRTVTEIFLINHNFKEYKVQYWDGAAYQDFATPVHPTGNTATVNWHTVAPIDTRKLRVTIYGTQVANSDKKMAQFIATSRIGKLNAWPVIKAPVVSKAMTSARMLSGKLQVVENVGYFGCTLQVANWKDSTDLGVVETIYRSLESVLVWLCGGDENQFSSKRIGYRLQDIYLMKPTNEYAPEFVKGIYSTGLNLSIKLEEVSD